MCALAGVILSVQGIAKLDLLAPKTQKECAVATIEYTDGARGGEAYFVPRSQGQTQLKGEGHSQHQTCDMQLQRNCNAPAALRPGVLLECFGRSHRDCDPPPHRHTQAYPCLVLWSCLFAPVGEDDGYLMVYVTKPDGTSYMRVYDAATFNATPVAEVRALGANSPAAQHLHDSMRYLTRLACMANSGYASRCA